MAEGFTEGFSDGYALGDGALVTVTDSRMRTAQSITMRPDIDHLLLRASLSANVAYSTPYTGRMVFDTPRVVACHIPGGLPLTVTVAGGSRQTSVVMFVSVGALHDVFGLADADLPRPLLDVVQGRNTAGTLATLPLTAPIATLVTQLVQSPLRGSLRRLQVEGRARELLAMMLDLVAQAPPFAGARAVRKRDVELAREAQSILAVEYRDPPTIEQLSRRVGLNQNKLKSLFPSLFGTTIHGFCVQRRMQEAQQLLLAGQLSIAQVAEQVGYEHQSSFAAAFRRFTGMAAKDYRKQRASLAVPLRAPDDGN